MNVGNLPDPVLITREAALKQLANTLAHEPIVAVDTESNSLYAYREQVCLIQFSTPKLDYLVDPLALKDLSPLASIFENHQIEKVFHAAEYDLLCLKRDFGFKVNQLFDTMIAARILGREVFGLGALLEAEFSIHLDKRFQRANWGQRPLPPHLLAYARLDTHYLIALRGRLLEDLRSQNLLPLAEEEFSRVSLVTPSGNGRDPEDRGHDCWRISGAYDITPQQAAILVELCRYRDKVARQLNRPLFKVLNDRTLLDIAIYTPGNMAELGQIQGMSPGQVERHGSAIMAAIERGLRAEPVYPPRAPRPDEQFLERVEALKRWRKQVAEEMRVTSDVVLPRDLLFRLAEHAPRTIEELVAAMSDTPWRRERFGGQILAVINPAPASHHHR
jgi:ribonuclease D